MMEANLPASAKLMVSLAFLLSFCDLKPCLRKQLSSSTKAKAVLLAGEPPFGNRAEAKTVRNEEKLAFKGEDRDILQANKADRTRRTSKAHGKWCFLSFLVVVYRIPRAEDCPVELRLHHQLANLSSEDEQSLSKLGETKRCWYPKDRLQTLLKPILQIEQPELAKLMVSDVSFLF